MTVQIGQVIASKYRIDGLPPRPNKPYRKPINDDFGGRK